VKIAIISCFIGTLFAGVKKYFKNDGNVLMIFTIIYQMMVK